MGGGRAAEEVIFGRAETTTGASSDLMGVSNMARQMVTAFGMSDVVPWAPSSDQSGDMIMRMMARNSMSEKLQADIDREVKKIADEAYEAALQQIRETARPSTRSWRSSRRRKPSPATSSGRFW